MNEYIEKQAVMNKFAEVVAPSNNSDFQKPPTWNDAVEIVENFPSADVRPVVRGRWKDKHLGPWGMVYATCSACKKRVALEQMHRNFCTNCGADMREKVKK